MANICTVFIYISLTEFLICFWRLWILLFLVNCGQYVCFFIDNSSSIIVARCSLHLCMSLLLFLRQLLSSPDHWKFGWWCLVTLPHLLWPIVIEKRGTGNNRIRKSILYNKVILTKHLLFDHTGYPSFPQQSPYEPENITTGQIAK